MRLFCANLYKREGVSMQVIDTFLFCQAFADSFVRLALVVFALHRQNFNLTNLCNECNSNCVDGACHRKLHSVIIKNWKLHWLKKNKSPIWKITWNRAFQIVQKVVILIDCMMYVCVLSIATLIYFIIVCALFDSCLLQFLIQKCNKIQFDMHVPQIHWARQ